MSETETTTTVVERENLDVHENPPERMLDMAERFGRMEAEYQATTRELLEVKANQSQTAALLSECLSELRAMQARQDTHGAQMVALSENQTELAAEVEQAEETETIELAPPMETKIEIEQKPVNSNRGIIHRLIYGNR